MCVAGALVSFAGQPGEEARWPTWRGAGRDGKSRETGLLKAWPEGGPKLLWRAAECGQGFRSVAGAGGLIYTAGDLDGRSCVVALDLDGKLKWRAPNGPAWRVPRSTGWAGSFDGTRATPTFDDGRVYHLSALGRLGCFDAKTGRELWAVDVTKRFGGRRPIWGYAESVLIDGEKLYVYPGGSEGYMAALDRKTGKVVWANKTIGQRAAYGSAVLVADGGVRQLITLTATAAIGVDAETGKLLWTHRHVNRHKDNVNTPIYHKGSVVICSGYERGLRRLCSEPRHPTRPRRVGHYISIPMVPMWLFFGVRSRQSVARMLDYRECIAGDPVRSAPPRPGYAAYVRPVTRCRCWP